MARTFTKNPTRELRPSQNPQVMQIPVMHQIFLGALLEACVAERIGFYVGKVGTTGSMPVSFYLDDETVKDYLAASDNPGDWIVRVGEVLFGAQVVREVIETIRKRLAGSGQEVPQTLQEAIAAKTGGKRP